MQLVFSLDSCHIERKLSKRGHHSNTGLQLVDPHQSSMANVLTTTLIFSLVILPWVVSSTPTSKNAEFDRDPSYWFSIAKQSISQAMKLQRNNKVARNVILFLGDGMSIPTLAAARIYKGQTLKRQFPNSGIKGEEEFLEFEKFPNVALIKTYNYDRQVPDSAATATSFLSGVKANYETLGLSAFSRFNDCSSVEPSKIKSIADWAQEAGKDAGLVTTTAVTHATPAALYAHAANRDWESDDMMTLNDINCKDIAKQLVEDLPGKKLKVVFGGGRQHFLPEANLTDPFEYGVRRDGRNLLNEWIENRIKENSTYRYVATLEELKQLENQKFDYALGLFASRHMNFEADRISKLSLEPSLTDMTVSAIKILNRSPNGYFLLVEGGRIDHAHHESRARHALQETLAMDQAIAATLKLINLDETLVLVTADHAHVMTFNGYPVRGNDILGIGDYSDIDSHPYTTLMYQNGPGFNQSRQYLPNINTSSYEYVQLSAVPRIDESHGGDDVAIYAQGPMAHLLHGLKEQNYIAHVMAYAACIGPYVKDCDRPSAAHIIIAETNLLLILVLLAFLFTHRNNV